VVERAGSKLLLNDSGRCMTLSRERVADTSPSAAGVKAGQEEMSSGRSSAEQGCHGRQPLDLVQAKREYAALQAAKSCRGRIHGVFCIGPPGFCPDLLRKSRQQAPTPRKNLALHCNGRLVLVIRQRKGNFAMTAGNA